MRAPEDIKRKRSLSLESSSKGKFATIDCNSIHWLVDLLGTMELLERVIGDPVFDVSRRGPERSEFQRDPPTVRSGLYFDGAHWHSIKDKKKLDSYKLDYQIDKTDHFCQSFAAMIHTGADKRYDLKKGGGEYAGNIEKVMQFWIDLFRSDSKLANFFMTEIHTSKYASGEYPELKAWKLKDLIAFLENVRRSARSLTGCRFG